MSTLLQDLRYSLRVMAGRPAFTAIAVVVLALGIGANSAVFTLVNELLLRPLPAERVPGELVGIYSKDRVRPDNYRGFSYPNYVDIREGADAFSGVLAEGISLAGVTEGDTTKRSFVFIVSSNYFETLAAHLALGRVFTPEEERPGTRAQVAVVSYAYWQQHGGQPDILGQTIRMNGRDFQIVGVTPRGFTGAHPMLAPEAYVPIGAYALVVNDLFQDDAAHTSLDDRQNTALVLIGRLKPGLTQEAAAPRLDALARRLEQAYPAANKDQTLVTHRLRRMGISTSPGDDGNAATAFVLLQAMAAVVLIIACLNLANMLLARASARRKEMGIRLALGAGRGRIVRQLLVEGFLLSLAGSAAGLVAAYWVIRVLISSFMVAIPFTIDFDPRPDARVVIATLVFAALSTIVFGLWPALRLARTDVVPELKEQTGDHSEGKRRWFTLRHALVVAQMALSLGLLTAGGLFVKGAIGAANADPGFPFRDGIVASVDPGLAGYDEARGREIYREILERVRALPGVRAASVASLIPYGEVTEGDTVRRPGTKGDEGRASAISNVVGADYFAVARAEGDPRPRVHAGRGAVAGRRPRGARRRAARQEALPERGPDRPAGRVREGRPDAQGAAVPDCGPGAGPAPRPVRPRAGRARLPAVRPELPLVDEPAREAVGRRSGGRGLHDRGPARNAPRRGPAPAGAVDQVARELPRDELLPVDGPDRREVLRHVRPAGALPGRRRDLRGEGLPGVAPHARDRPAHGARRRAA